MYGIIRTLQAQPGKKEALIKVWTETAATSLKRQPGLKNLYLLDKPNSDELLLVSIWETVAQAQAWQTSAAHQSAEAEVMTLAIGPPDIASYEVEVHL